MARGYKLGKTIVGARGRDRSIELGRMAERRKLWRRNALVWGVCIAVVGGLVAWVALETREMVKEREDAAVDTQKWEPTVEIVSEGGGQVSERMREFVAKLERDFRDLGFGVDKVVLPLGMSREVDVYVGTRGEYYKMSVDRGSAVQAEDAERMMRYLDEREIVVQYVDLRVEGKAYYR